MKVLLGLGLMLVMQTAYTQEEEGPYKHPRQQHHEDYGTITEDSPNPHNRNFGDQRAPRSKPKSEVNDNDRGYDVSEKKGSGQTTPNHSQRVQPQ